MQITHANRYSFVESDATEELDDFGDEVERGLSAHPKSLPCRFLYDAQGSEIFEAICDLPEYYPTRTERSILERHADDIVSRFETPITLAELGSGSSTKTRLLIEALLRSQGRLRYLPVDISRSILDQSARELLDSYQGLEIHAIASEYRVGLGHLGREQRRPKLIAWLGSNIGNFAREEAARFVSGIRDAMSSDDHALFGIDLRKGRERLESAYDDAQGVTADFNLNLLARINRELGGRFRLDRFEHRARWRPVEGRVKLDLVSRVDQEVEIQDLGLAVKFREGEAIHTEDSYKYSVEEIDALAAQAGLRVVERWLDDRAWFSLNLLAPV
jgi:dimethylhistidine N-methyltransferase